MLISASIKGLTVAGMIEKTSGNSDMNKQSACRGSPDSAILFAIFDSARRVSVIELRKSRNRALITLRFAGRFSLHSTVSSLKTNFQSEMKILKGSTGIK